MTRWVALFLSFSAPTWAQVPGPSQAAVDDAVRLGTVAALAPLCGLRPERWAFDLRRSAILEATRAGRPDDSALRSAPGSETIGSALSYAETEALEEFASAAPAETCVPLAIDPDLARADAMVEAFRALKAVKPAS